MQASLERLRRRREDPENEGGFTLIELLIVIVILGILAAIVVFAVQNLSGQSSQASCSSDYKTVETAAEGYKTQLGVYPGGTPIGYNVDTTVAVPNPPTGMPAAASAGDQLLMTTYINSAGQTVGPWLKDYPYNASHYSIGVDGTVAATGTVTAYNGNGAPQAAGVAGCTTVS